MGQGIAQTLKGVLLLGCLSAACGRHESPPKEKAVARFPSSVAEAHRLVRPVDGASADLLHSLAAGLVDGRYNEVCERLRWSAGAGAWDVDLHEEEGCTGENGSCCRALVRPRGSLASATMSSPPPLHPFSAPKRVTLASFRTMDEPLFLALPGPVRVRFKELKSQAEHGRPPPSPRGALGSWLAPVRVPAGELRGDEPAFLDGPWWAVGEEGAARMRPEAVLFLVRAVDGPYQVELEFAEEVPGAVFAARAPAEDAAPRIVPFERAADGAPFSPSPAVVGGPAAEDGRHYAGSVRNTNGRFDMVWDPRTGSIALLAVRTGYADGGFPLVMDGAHLIRRGRELFLLRASTLYAEALSLTDGGLAVAVLADRRYWRPDSGTVTFLGAKGKSIPVVGPR
ncbi:MAG: hypothetical protein HYZ75_18180 [Elusimicrobia bacterium]|nr:hypothetical protein [Elusimicrobiota bacterium]